MNTKHILIYLPIRNIQTETDRKVDGQKMMDRKELFTTQRTGQRMDKVKHERTEFQRDYDRMIFSAPFRRLQNKTQVFPLPGAVFVHNRLTHSLEVASVGRSLGHNISQRIAREGEDWGQYSEEISSIVATACLAHDMGNPPFGHSGEKAISHYFSTGRGRELLAESDMTEAQKSDLTNFDGNANSLRLLAHSYRGRRDGGFALTFPAVASVIKYPRSSVGQKKFGYFQQDKKIFDTIMDRLGVLPRNAEKTEYCRYPLVYLVEAADDICYEIMDVEDAYRLGILEYDEAVRLLRGFFGSEADDEMNKNIDTVFEQITDKHEHINYLRSIAIGRLVNCCTDIFWNNREAILRGEFKGSLIDKLPESEKQAMDKVVSTAMSRIYKHQMVREVELSGFKIIGTLLDTLITAMCNPDMYYSSLIEPFVPEQYRVGRDASLYDKCLAAVDTVASMTDLYALDLYKKVKGIL